MKNILFDAAIKSYLQILPAIDKCLTKGRDHFLDEDRSLDSLVLYRLYEDMEPFHFQIVCMMHQCSGAIEGLRSGYFFPPSREIIFDYDGLQTHVREGIEAIDALTMDEFLVITDGEVKFQGKSFTVNFTSTDFLLSFALPNFYFHAATTYDMLRINGVPLGKLDFLGEMRFKE